MVGVFPRLHPRLQAAVVHLGDRARDDRAAPHAVAVRDRALERVGRELFDAEADALELCLVRIQTQRQHAA